jgi:hypothetical protein
VAPAMGSVWLWPVPARRLLGNRDLARSGVRFTPVTAHDHAGVPAQAQGYSSPVLAVIRLRLHPQLECDVFERWLRGIPAVLSAMLITGDADYELQVSCRCLADLGDTLTWICGCPGVEVASAALVLHEVAGLGRQRRAYADEVTTPRLRTM